MRWRERYEEEGIEDVKWNGQRGSSKLTNAQKKKLKRIILKGATSYRYPNELWTTFRIMEIIRKEFKVKFHQEYIWRRWKRNDMTNFCPVN